MSARPRPVIRGLDKISNPAQLGSVEQYVLDNGAGRGVRVLCVNTGGGLRYRVLVDRGLDIDQAFFNQHSLTYLAHQGVTRPTRALDRGIDWLKGFPVGLLTTCGPFNIGAPARDGDEDLGLHGHHSNTAAELQSVEQPDPRAGKLDMSVVGFVRYGQLYGPQAVLKRTIRSTLGSNAIHFRDEITNLFNEPTPHAWLLHINLGYPLVDEGARFCVKADKPIPRDDALSRDWFSGPADRYLRVPAPLKSHRGAAHVFAYFPLRSSRRDGVVDTALLNERLGLALVVSFNTKQFPNFGIWQHWGPGEYVCALEPMNGGVEGRDKDRAAGRLDTLDPGETRTYDYSLRVETDPAALRGSAGR
jgi:hypothetical protein